jgi:hypothetical protein
LLKEAGGANTGPRPYVATAELLGYCVQGSQRFTECNGPSLTEAVEARLAAALEAGDSCVVLLTMHAGVIQQSVVERYGLEAG